MLTKAIIRAAEVTREGILITDARSQGNEIVYVNQAFCRTTGYAQDEVLGRNPRFLQGPDTDPEATAKVGKALRAGRSCVVQLTNYRKNGEAWTNRLSISPIHITDRKRPDYYVGIQSDVTGLSQILRERDRMRVYRTTMNTAMHEFLNTLNGLQLLRLEMEDAMPSAALTPHFERFDALLAQAQQRMERLANAERLVTDGFVSEQPIFRVGGGETVDINTLAQSRDAVAV